MTAASAHKLAALRAELAREGLAGFIVPRADEPPPAWLAKHVPDGGAIGYDPLLISEDALARYTDARLVMRPVARNPVDAVWADRPAPPENPAVPHPEEYAGR